MTQGSCLSYTVTNLLKPHLLMILFIWLSFSSCCLRSLSSLSSSLDLYSISSFCICCSCTRSRRSYSSSRRLDTFRRSFSFAISCSYCRWKERRKESDAKEKGRDQIIIICCCCSEKDIVFFMKNKLIQLKQITNKQL